MAVVAPYYIRNPEVVLREVDEDGALLFNPDTNQVKVINDTALFIWQKCDGKSDLAALKAAIQEAYDDVPQDQLADQVQIFLDEMVRSGFIGNAEYQSS